MPAIASQRQATGKPERQELRGDWSDELSEYPQPDSNR
jgi:hypothetical protein